MNAANKIVAFDKAIGHERAAMETATVKHRNLVIETNNDKIDLADERIFRAPIFQLIIFCD